MHMCHFYHQLAFSLKVIHLTILVVSVFKKSIFRFLNSKHVLIYLKRLFVFSLVGLCVSREQDLRVKEEPCHGPSGRQLIVTEGNQIGFSQFVRIKILIPFQHHFWRNFSDEVQRSSWTINSGSGVSLRWKESSNTFLNVFLMTFEVKFAGPRNKNSLRSSRPKMAASNRWFSLLALVLVGDGFFTTNSDFSWLTPVNCINCVIFHLGLLH